MHSGKMNSTELFSSVQFPAVVHWTGDDLRRFTTIRRRSWRSSQVLHNQRTLSWIGQSTQCLSLDENRRRAATTGNGRRRSSQLVVSSMHSGKLNSSQLNWTVRSSSVEFSSVFIARQHTDARYWYRKSVRPSVLLLFLPRMALNGLFLCWRAVKNLHSLSLRPSVRLSISA